MYHDPDGNEISQADYEMMLDAWREEMHGDVAPLSVFDLPTQAEVEDMARRHGVDLPF